MAEETRAPGEKKAPSRAAAVQEQRADVERQAYLLQVAAETGWTPAEAERNIERLQTEGDFHDAEGRWTLDASGKPVCLKGWVTPPPPTPEA